LGGGFVLAHFCDPLASEGCAGHSL
jgi:hypothetical protein